MNAEEKMDKGTLERSPPHAAVRRLQISPSKTLDNYIVDFYCSELRLVIEIDGDSHAETVEYDAARTRVLQSLGLVVVRYTNDDVIRNIQGVYDDLRAKIEKLTPHQHSTPLAPLIRGGLIACISPSLDKGRIGEGFDSDGDRHQ